MYLYTYISLCLCVSTNRCYKAAQKPQVRNLREWVLPRLDFVLPSRNRQEASV